MSNSSVVQDIYSAFGQGDVTTIFGHLSESVDWEYGADNSRIPWLQHGYGHEGATAFFSALNKLEFQKFQPKTFLEGDGVVIALLDVEMKVKSTGKIITEEDEAHIWYFDTAGKVTKFRHRADTLQHYLANQE